jgi:uncharacterized protein (DUF1330 family)
VKNRAGLERYWQVAPAVYPENVDVLVGYAPFEVLDADQDERVEGVVIAEFPPFEAVEWFNGDAYVQARKDRTNGNEYLSMVVDSGVAPISKRSADMPAYVVFVCREIVDQEELNTYWQRVNETLVGHNARVLMDRGRFMILEGQGPVQGVTVYEFPTKDAARNWHNNVAYREVRQHRKKGAKYLVILAEGGISPVEQRMPHTRVAGSTRPVPVENQIRTYSWCNPPRIGRQRMRPVLFTVRDRGASLSKAKCVRVSL